MNKIKLAIINIGIGNIGSIINCINKLNINPVIVSSGEELSDCNPTHILMPGVGAVKEAMKNINKRNLVGSLEKLVFNNKCFLCGICLGMQILSESSDEFGYTKCLGWIPGKVSAISVDNLSIPHMGWNKMIIRGDADKIFSGIEGKDMYFAHSHSMKCPEKYIISYTNYGGKIVSSIKSGNIYGIQCHPEKSASVGKKFIQNFLTLEHDV